MIYHASIPADEPERVARVIAELWCGEQFPFVFRGSFIVFADDERGSQIEVWPRGLEQTPGPKEVSIKTNAAPSPNSETHILVATPLSEGEVLAIGKREGWTARICHRGGNKLIEFWLENKFLLELMTKVDAEQYQRHTTIEGWRVWMAALKAQGLSPHEWERYKPVASGPAPEPEGHRKT
jgi:hypothetical protein